MKYIIIIASLSFMLQPETKPFDQIKQPPKIESDSTKAAYSVLSKSDNISSIEFKKLKNKSNTIYLSIGTKKQIITNENSTAYGIGGVSNSEEAKKKIGPTIQNVTIFKGKYEDMLSEKISDIQTGYRFKKVQYPINLTISFAGEKASFEITEPGNWNVEIKLKK